MSEDQTEEIARQWLEGQKEITDVRYISDTNDQPPDFVVDNRIAVEVRRLSWMTDTTKPNQSAEAIERPLWQAIRKVLDEANSAPGMHNVHVWCDLLHDILPKPRETQEQVENAVQEYTDLLSEQLQTVGKPLKWRTELECGMSLRFYPNPIPKEGKFVLEQVTAATSLRGSVVADSIDNINRCIVEKTAKVRDSIHKHSEWWLILVDHELFTPLKSDWDEWQQIQDELVETRPWSRIVVIGWNESLAIPLRHVDLLKEKPLDFAARIVR